MQIHCSASHGDIDGVRLQLDLGVGVDARTHGQLTPLMAAAASNGAGVTMLRFLVEHGADVNAIGRSGHETPLGKAARAGDLAKVQYLVSAGADPHYKDPDGYTTLIHAGNAEVIQYLLEQGVSPDGQTSYSESALRIWSSRGEFQIVRQLLDAGADPAPLGWTALHRAVALGDLSSVRREVESGADLSARDSWERTPWLLSVQGGDVGKAQILKTAGAKFADSGRCGKSLLAYCVQNDQPAMLQWLLDQGADMEAADEFGQTAITQAAEAGAVNCARLLIAAGARLRGDYRPDETALTDERERLRQILSGAGHPDAEFLAGMLDQCCPPERPWAAIGEARTIEVVRAMVEAGEDINYVRSDGYWLLRCAVEDGNLQMVKELLALGARADTTSTGATALHDAISGDHLEIADLLLRAGANPNAQDVDGWTPLFFAASAEAVQLLLKAGADRTLRDQCGQTAAERIADPFVRDAIHKQ